MKKVIFPDNTKTVNISNVTSQRFYGWEMRGTKGLIHAADYNRGGFKAYSPNYLTSGNAISIPEDNGATLKSLIENLVKIAEVYEFETAKELFKWLSE